MSYYRNLVWFAKGLREYTKNGFESAALHFDSKELDSVNLQGRSVLVTGANSGLGLVCCKELAKRGAEVHMVCRNPDRAEVARLAVTQYATESNARVHLHQLDMSMPRKVVEFAHKFSKTQSKLDILINNAGCMVNELKIEDNLEANFATNTLGLYLLTEGLFSCLEKATDPRVIVVSSGGMLVQKLDHTDPMLINQRTSFDGTMVYAQNKRQQVVMTEMWADAHKNIHFSSMHPGWADTPAVASSMPSFYNRMQGRLRTPEQGADTIIWLAMTPNIKSYPSGSFFQDRKPVATHLRFARTHSKLDEKQTFMTKLAELSLPFTQLTT